MVAQGMLKYFIFNFVYLQYSVEKCYILHTHLAQKYGKTVPSTQYV